MTLIEFLMLLLVAGVCGSIGQSIAGVTKGGCLVSIAVGFIGALLGMWVAGALGLPEVFVIRIDGEGFPIVWSIVGSALFVALISFISRGSRRR
ncbi:hypothetical protein [Engelhardtia mirabilis]|uniref:Transglycosylase associated protein n=1 Tax=Engelhardtia mirabilis TaxID=2528011 RepID=A0A518BNC6_9BACT|nr:hypothetical protein Pla133_35870 [Planctomycetes bacterium Pla133]QDV02814.1 hypothetical protein Pla86_35850 [Planctomycetes bacterium Pla86]